MNDAEEYRGRAQYYLIRARQMTTLEGRAAFIDLAGIWMRMAEQAETNQRFLRQLQQAIEFYSIPASQQFRGVAVKVEEAKKPSRAKVGAKS